MISVDHSPLTAILKGGTEDLLLQTILLVASMFFAAWLVRQPGDRLRGTRLSPRNWLRLTLPPVALLLVVIARSITESFLPPTLLDLAVPLLLSLTAIQFAFFALRGIFKPGPFLSSLEHFVSWLAWGLVALHFTGYLDDLIRALDAIGIPVGKQRISLYTAALGLVALAGSLLIALWAARLLETRFIDGSSLNANLKVALAKILRAVLLVVAVLVALPVVGIDITVLSVFGGALGVGLGLGLQKIAANYVSGFTLLLDQSIRIGDIVTIGAQQGTVTRIATRYTMLQTQDGSESIIPNENLITSTVINHSLAKRGNRIEMPIQVAYKSDLEQVKTLLLEIACEHPRVAGQPTPRVFLKNFADSGIELALAFWINDPENSALQLKSDINWAIWRRFGEAGIEIPYPQRVVHTHPAEG